MPITAVIVSYKSVEDVLACLAALEMSRNTDFEVLICENGGSKAFKELEQRLPAQLRSGPRVRALQAPENLGYAGGVNFGIRSSPGSDAWWILNPDTRPEPDALEALTRRLRKNDVAVVGATVLRPDGRVHTRGGVWRPWLARAETIGHGQDPDEPVDSAVVERQISFVSGACMLISREMLRVAGLMDERFFLYGEEVEWCLRAKDRGLQLGYAPDARIAHEGGTSTGAVPDMRSRPRLPVYLDERNKLLLTRDRHPHAAPLIAVAALCLAVLRFAKRGAWRQVGYALQGWWAGVRNSRGKPEWCIS